MSGRPGSCGLRDLHELSISIEIKTLEATRDDLLCYDFSVYLCIISILRNMFMMPKGITIDVPYGYAIFNAMYAPLFLF